ncbi:hypothetical protein [Shimia sp. FJ5]|uniref:hypothetical protein n=1 Tax=Shimia sp. FJ5 TaxID=3079054 RepID=UPI00260B6EEB|nr:hypothetical protein [Shimia sp. FJ5]MDV4146044.1 hypothetical protein [Shimia sp. FJ5]
MKSYVPDRPTADCRALIEAVETRARTAEKEARALPRTARQAYIYDHTFTNEIEAVAYHLATAINRVPDFRDPFLYAEKLRSLYLTHPNPLMSLVADKVFLPRYCAHFDTPIRPPKIHAVHDDPADLDLSSLPQTAMLKISDGCKMNLLHGPGMPVTRFAYRRFLRQFWHIDHWRRHAELHYRDIPRRLMVEEALLPIERLSETGVFCAFGRPYMAITKSGYAADRFYGAVDGILALEDSLKPLERYEDMRPPPFGTAFPDPFRDAMLETTRRLAAPLPHCRVDFMLSEGRCFLGEISISPVALRDFFHEPEQQKMDSDLFDLSKLPDCLAQGRAIAAKLGWPTETSFGHVSPDDPRLATGGQ